MNNCVYKTSFLFTHFLPSRHTAFYPLSKEFPKSEKHTVEPLCNGHLADRRKWPLWRGWNKSECMTVCPKKLPLWRGGPLVDWFNCTWITIKLGPFPSFFERQRQRETVQPPSSFSWFRVLISLDLSSPLYPASSGCSWQDATLQRERNHCQQQFAFPSSKRVHMIPTSKCQMTSLSLVLQQTLAKQQLCICIKLFRTFLCCFCMTTTLKCLISRLLENVNKHQPNFFLFLCPDMVPSNSTPVWFTYIWQCKWVGIMKEHKFTAGLH